MANGTTRPISEIEVGDQVLATDPETGETGAREVIATMPHTDQLLTLRLSSGDVVTTEDHRYWNQTDQVWQESQDLDAGDQLLTADGDQVTVEGLDWSTVHTDAAYDLDVADLDSFYVDAGNEAVLVHNADDCGIHGMFRGATRNVDIDDVVSRGTIYRQANGDRVYVVANGDGTNSAVILKGALPTDPLRTVLDSVSDSSLAARIADGRWMPGH